MNKKFYITTPIYYPSGDLHIGHAYTTTLADVICKYKSQQGFETYFLTGSDEHGQKIQAKAAEANLTEIDFLKEKISDFKNLWKILDISYNQFIRTTDNDHMESVQKIFSELLSKNHIYKDYYDGLYCISCESSWQLSQVEKVEGKYVCDDCKRPLDTVKEESYFMKLKGEETFIKDLFNTDFLIPKRNVSELLTKFVEPGLLDLSVSRTTFKWGVPVLEDNNHVVYVWVDALPNYITALGYGKEDTTLLDKFWTDDTEILHLVGKEIVRFHAIYWPVMLKNLGILRKNIKVMGHGWITSEGKKMSKSLGNVINPVEIVEKYGAEHLRYYLMKEISTTNDGDFSQERFINAYNSDLANKFGNLVSRVHAMIDKYFDGKIPPYHQDQTSLDVEFEDQIKKQYDRYKGKMDEYNVSAGIKEAITLAELANLYIDNAKPWELAKKDGEKKDLESVLNRLVKSIEVITFMLEPIIKTSALKALNQFNIEKTTYENVLDWEKNNNIIIGEKTNLFPRLDKE